MYSQFSQFKGHVSWICVWVTQFAFLLLASNSCLAVSLESPNRRLALDVKLIKRGGHSVVAYSVSYDGEQVLDKSTISFTGQNGVSIGMHLHEQSAPEKTICKQEWKPVYGERSLVIDNYEQIAWKLADQQANMDLILEFRCYDAGIAFRSTLTRGDTNEQLHVEAERSEFRFQADHTAFCTTSAQGEYSKRPISKIGSEVERPLVLQSTNNRFYAIAEAGLVDYARMKIVRDLDDKYCLKSNLSSPVRSVGSITTPWRVVMVASSPGELLEQNDIFMNLSQPCQLQDTSWIRPGKVIRDISLTNAGAKACIDFAAKYNLQFVEFDAGWYGHEYDDSSDATTVTLDQKRSSGPFDLPEIIAYANKHDIGVILYVNRRALETQLDDILPLYESWGVAGVKYGFVNVGSQQWTSWLHQAVRKAADHRLMVDVHDEYRPTGYSRTYPNLMTQEGVRGDEAAPRSEQALTTLFTRCLAGASDHTVCYFDERVDNIWSHSHQLAKAVCCYSPWQFLFWYDTPQADAARTIKETPELEFFSHLPTTWDDTKVVHGEIGEYAVIARRSGQEWYVGAMNNSHARSLEVPLDFLEEDQAYLAHLYEDDPTVSTVTQVKITHKKVDQQAVLSLRLQANGGFAIRVEPLKQSEATVAKIKESRPRPNVR